MPGAASAVRPMRDGAACAMVADVPGEAQRALRVVIADAGYGLHAAIAPLLEAEPGVELSATCADADELLAAIDAFSPAVVLTDVDLGPGADAAPAARLRETHPEVGVILVGERGLTLVERGADGRACALMRRLADQLA